MPAPLLSVVIPVYNVARYLPSCLDSLAQQTYPIDEIIVVDDGSTDNCPSILAEYASRLPQMHILRQENGGLSAARNTGLTHATGQYLAFVDSDDFLAPQMFAQLLAIAQADNLDMALCNANFHHEGREKDRPIYAEAPSSGVISGKEWLRERLSHGRLMHMVWMHLYRRDFLVQKQFRFVPRLIHEDVIWTTEALLAARRVKYDATPLYQYRIPIRKFTPESNRRRLEAIIQSSIYNAKELLRIANESPTDEELKQLLRWQAVDGAFSVFHKIDRIDDRNWQRSQFREVRLGELFPLLWKNANGWIQYRKIIRNYVKALLAESFHG